VGDLSRYVRMMRLLAWKRDATPVYLIHFVTERCNMRCAHCFVGRKKGDEMSAAEVRMVARRLGPHAFSVMVTGGEPLLRGDLYEICEAYLSASGIRYLQIATNGSFPHRTEDIARRLAAAFPQKTLSVALSVDGVGEAHDTVRGSRGAFEAVMETHSRLLKLRDARPNVEVGVNVTASALNQWDLEDTYVYLRDVARARNVFFNLVRGDPRDPRAAEVDPSRYEGLVKMWSEDVRSGRIGYARFPLASLVNAQNLLTRRIVARMARGGRGTARCYAGLLSGVIYPDGVVRACELLPLVVGRLREEGYDLVRVWRGRDARRAREVIRESRCSCTHECFLVTNVLFDPRYLPALGLEAARCLLGRLRGPGPRGDGRSHRDDHSGPGGRSSGGRGLGGEIR